MVGNLGPIGGSTAQMFFDDGTNGDVTAGDNVFTYAALVPANTSTGSKVLPITVMDAQARSATTSIGLLVSSTGDPQVHLTMGNPSGATTDVNNPTSYLLPKSQYVMSYHLALIYSAMGDKEKALAELENAFNEHDYLLPRIKVEPFLDPLRDDPRFTAIVRRMGLPE